MCLCPASSQVGDLVCFIRDADVPFVLRPVDNDRFELLGEAYMHGFMHGEVGELCNLYFRTSTLQ
jgi:hypothetical protein